LVGIAGVAVVSATALLAPLAVPAGATNPTTSSCTTETFPTAWGSQSNVKWACHFMSAAAGSAQVMHDYPQAVWHNGAARTATASWTNGGTTLTASNGHFTANDVNHIVADTGAVAAGLPTYVFIKSVTDANTVVLNKAVTATGTNRAIKIENSSIRSVDDAVTTASSTTVTSATANFTAGDVGRSITGTTLPPGTIIATRVSATEITVSNGANASATAQVLAIGSDETVTSARVVNDAVFASSTTITSATAGFATSDIGLKVASTAGIPSGAYITAINSATSVTISAATTVTGTAKKLIIGESSVTAPVNGDQVGGLASTLQLNPTLVKGSLPCASGIPFGTTIAGGWYNPGAYLAGGLFGAEPTNVATIGQLAFPTSVVSFFGYVTTPVTDPGSPAAPQTGSHYEIRFPNIPTSLALCTGTNTTSTFSFQGTTLGTSKVTTGTGRPSTAVRGLQRPSSATVDQKAWISTTKSGATTNRSGSTCTFRQVPEYGFPCGQG
jgi:hypothetical protein